LLLTRKLLKAWGPGAKFEIITSKVLRKPS